MLCMSLRTDELWEFACASAAIPDCDRIWNLVRFEISVAILASRTVDSAAVVFRDWLCITCTADCNRFEPAPITARWLAVAIKASLIAVSDKRAPS